MTNAFAFLARTARNSPWLVMSITAHGIAIAVLSVVYLKHHAPEPPPDRPVTITLPVGAEPEPEPLEPAIEPIARKAIPKEFETELVPEDLSFYVPTDLAAEPDYTKEVGAPDGELGAVPGDEPVSGAIGVGEGSARGTRVGPWSNRIRLTGKLGVPDGDGRPTEVTPTEKAVLAGLRWLLRHQNEDGSWGLAHLDDRCDPGSPCAPPTVERAGHYDEGLTGLALLAFLGAGIGHDAKVAIVDTVRGKKHSAGDAVKRGLKWLRERQNPDGSFSRDRAFLYNEALATMALAEAHGVSPNRLWQESAQRGVDFLVAAQRPSPAGDGAWGWRYASRQEVERFHGGGSRDAAFARELHDSDNSVTAWAVMALKSAELAGLRVDRAAYDGALAFTRWTTGSDGLVGYVDPQSAGQAVGGRNDHFAYHTATMSALGACIRIFAAHDAADPFLDQAARRLVADLPAVSKDGLSVDYYYWYYASLALNQLDGPDSPRRTGRYWGPWHRAMVEALLGTQDGAPKACRNGGWTRGDRWSYAGGPVYATALNVLTLEVHYRYPNAFGRGPRSPAAPIAEPAPKMLIAEAVGR